MLRSLSDYVEEVRKECNELVVVSLGGYVTVSATQKRKGKTLISDSSDYALS